MRKERCKHCGHEWIRRTDTIPVKCPKCHTLMGKMVDNDQPHILYESCDICYGVFFDAGEFRDYKEEGIVDFFKDIIKKSSGIKKVIGSYYGDLRKGIKTGYFDVVAHFDIIKIWNKNKKYFSGNERWYKKEVIKTLKEVKKKKMKLEINTAGWRKPCKEQYPAEWIIKKAKKIIKPIIIKLKGNNLLEKIVYGITLGDLVSLYLAELLKRNYKLTKRIDYLVSRFCLVMLKLKLRGKDVRPTFFLKNKGIYPCQQPPKFMTKQLICNKPANWKKRSASSRN